MTREEAIAILQDKYDCCKSFYDLAAHPEEDYPEMAKYLQALQIALSALRPVSREQVEKVFPGCRSCKSCRSCVFCTNNLKDMPCKKCDPNAECVVTEYKPSNFCPVCGKPLTDEAVDMVMERLEALYGQENT